MIYFVTTFLRQHLTLSGSLGFKYYTSKLRFSTSFLQFNHITIYKQARLKSSAKLSRRWLKAAGMYFRVGAQPEPSRTLT